MADNQLRLPSGQGGLTRFTEEVKSKIELTPKAVVVIVLIVMIIVILLHSYGGSFLSS